MPNVNRSGLADFGPLVSVIIPAFNVERYIAEAVGSALRQTYFNIEIIIVDDASTDGTAVIANELALKDQRVRLIKNRRSKGAAGARNTGIDSANGQWIAFLDADDWWSDTAIAYRVEALGMFPDVEMISGDMFFFQDGRPPEGDTLASTNSFWVLHLGGAKQSGIPLLIQDPARLFVQHCLTSTICVMVAASLLRRVGGFDERFGRGEDVHLWLRLSAVAESFVFVPQSVAGYRVREGSLTNSGKALFEEDVYTYSDLLHRQEFRPYRKSLKWKQGFFAEQNAYFYRRSRRKLVAIRWSAIALSKRPLSFSCWKSFVATLLLH